MRIKGEYVLVRNIDDLYAIIEESMGEEVVWALKDYVEDLEKDLAEADNDIAIWEKELAEAKRELAEERERGYERAVIDNGSKELTHHLRNVFSEMSGLMEAERWTKNTKQGLRDWLDRGKQLVKEYGKG